MGFFIKLYPNQNVTFTVQLSYITYSELPPSTNTTAFSVLPFVAGFDVKIDRSREVASLMMAMKAVIAIEHYLQQVFHWNT